jgi:2-C-methyl-D-erythritol 4-phosphate cytidylyltransferase
MTLPNYWAIVPAAGVGKRMQSDRPKQYLELLGKPVLQHTLEKLCGLSEISGVVVCVAEHDPYFPRLSLPDKIRTAPGGEERFHSVRNGLAVLREYARPGDWVLVHDAARPCVRPEDIRRLMRELSDHPVGGLLATPVRDTMKRADAHGMVTETVSRAGLWHALTPQMFRLEKLTRALENVLAGQTVVTDDAEAMERMGWQPVLLEGHADNLKITHPHDLALAEWILRRQIESA